MNVSVHARESPPASPHDRQLRLYAELAVKVGLNLRAGQRLLIIGPLANGGVSLEAAPLVRQIAAAAYRAGAPLVETIWGDEAMQMARFRHAPRDSFGEFSHGSRDALFEHAEAGHALISVYANDPDQLKDRTAGAGRAPSSRRSRRRSVRSASSSREIRRTGRSSPPRVDGLGRACISRLSRAEQRVARCGRRSRRLVSARSSRSCGRVGGPPRGSRARDAIS